VRGGSAGSWFHIWSALCLSCAIGTLCLIRVRSSLSSDCACNSVLPRLEVGPGLLSMSPDIKSS